jgi:hypothetical protein
MVYEPNDIDEPDDYELSSVLLLPPSTVDCELSPAGEQMIPMVAPVSG